MQTLAVLGAGTMGTGIAQVALSAGFRVFIFDVNAEALPRAQAQIAAGLQKAASLGKMTEDQAAEANRQLTTTTAVTDLVADIIIEAAVENLAVKQQLFAQLEEINTPECLLTTNTSSLSVTAIGAQLKHQSRFAGLHFFNPAPAMKLVEITRGLATTDATVAALQDLCKRLGKTAVTCQDAPGFIVNRVARPYYTEALYLAGQQTADLATIDDLLEATGFRMGPFRLMDMIGHDINFAVTTGLYQAFHQEPRFRPSLLQQQLVQAGRLGRKSGQGFYSY